MNKDTNKLIPELRFPEFKNEGEWEKHQIDTLGETISGLSGKSAEDFGTGKPYVTYKQVFDKAFIDFSDCGKVNISENENQNTLQKGDVLFTTSSETPNEVGFASVLLDTPKESTYLNSFCFALRPYNLKFLNPEFSRYLFHSPTYRKSISALAQGSTRYNISKGAFLNLNLFLPNPKEQQKIASCLSSLDEVIETQNKKLELLKDHKKGLMQNLFPQEGEKVPNYRFPEFVNDGEWEEKSLGEVSKSFSGGTPTTIQKEFYDGNIPFIRSAEINKEVTELFLTEEGLKNSSAKLVSKGDVLIALYGANSGDVAISKIDGAINQAILCIRTEFSNMFICQYLSSKKDWIVSKYIQGGQGNLSGEIVKSISIPFPTKSEQQKIADCLSSLDEQIAAQTQKTEQLKQHKKGLMQRLFPKVR